MKLVLSCSLACLKTWGRVVTSGADLRSSVSFPGDAHTKSLCPAVRLLLLDFSVSHSYVSVLCYPAWV